MNETKELCGVDIKENYIYSLDKAILSLLLKDRSSDKNIIWATDTYAWRGVGFEPQDCITVKSITGKRGNVIKPRTQKSQKEQRIRIKKKAEVFTPSWICNEMANHFDEVWFGHKNVFNVENIQSETWKATTEKIAFPDGMTWQDYIRLKILEISCGEAPFLASRYDTVTGKWLNIKDRIGILDRKLRIISENTNSEKDWVEWAFEAYKATYGYEWQGDSLLISRENLLFTFIDYYVARFDVYPINEYLTELAKILSWNIWQMDGLKGVVPYSCKPLPKMQISLFDFDEPLQECPGCASGNNRMHTGIYCKIKNWKSNKNIPFISVQGDQKMKFDFVIGNPPYQGDNHYQIYPDFYIESRKIGGCVELIFPTGWQTPKNANNLKRLNTSEIKEDEQIVFIDNKQNVFNGIAGAEWTNIILWKHGYDNGLNGKQLVYTNGEDPHIVQLLWDKNAVTKPQEIIDLVNIVKAKQEKTMNDCTSSLKPYGLRTDFLDNPSKYNLPDVQLFRQNDDDIALYGLKQRKQIVCYLPSNYPVPKLTKAFDKYKVFIGKAWGNFSKSYLGGAYADIVVAKPREICTENFIESGCFDDLDSARKHAKYLMTKFARALLFALKNTQDNSKEKWATVPIQNFSECWWDMSIIDIDEQLFKKYDIPQNIRDFVNDNIQQRTELNIINF